MARILPRQPPCDPQHRHWISHGCLLWHWSLLSRALPEGALHHGLVLRTHPCSASFPQGSQLRGREGALCAGPATQCIRHGHRPGWCPLFHCRRKRHPVRTVSSHLYRPRADSKREPEDLKRSGCPSSSPSPGILSRKGRSQGHCICLATLAQPRSLDPIRSAYCGGKSARGSMAKKGTGGKPSPGSLDGAAGDGKSGGKESRPTGL